jgi:CRP-like cAMP-binding protein
MANVEVLKEVDIFAELTEDQLTRIDALCSEQSFEQGARIFQENSLSQELYIIMNGKVEIQVDPDTIGKGGDNSYEPTTIATLRWGQCFGEIALVDQGVRSASARCGSDNCRLLVINIHHFMRLLQDDPEMGFVVMRNLAADLAFKIRQTNLMIRESLMYNNN